MCSYMPRGHKASNSLELARVTGSCEPPSNMLGTELWFWNRTSTVSHLASMWGVRGLVNPGGSTQAVLLGGMCLSAEPFLPVQGQPTLDAMLSP